MILNILHSFLNIFAGGRSDIKVYLFILYIILLSILYFLLKKHSIKTLKWKWFGIGILLMYLYGLLLYIFYVLSNNLLLTDFLITGNNAEISSSILWHTHLAKGAIGQIFSFWGTAKLETMDAGGVYIGLIPSPIFLLGSILLMTVIIQAIFYFITSFKILLEDKNNRQKIFLIIGYAITTFSLIKTSIDGGLFNPSFGIGIIFIILFALRIKGKIITNYYYLISFVAIILIAVSLYINSFRYGNGLEIAIIATLLLLYNAILYGSEEKIRLQFFIPILVLFIIGWWVASARDRNIYDYSKILLNTKQEVYTYNENNKEIEIIKIEEPQSVARLSKNLNKNISYMPITVSGVTCMAKGPYQEFSVTLISAK